MAKKSKSPMEGFMDFVKEQGVVGMAVGITVGVAAADMVARIVDALVSPLIAWILGDASLNGVGIVELGDSGSELMFGSALDAVLRFLVVAFAVYVMVRALGADKWGK